MSRNTDVKKNDPYLGEIFNKFKENIVQINFYQSFTKSISNITLKKLFEQHEIAKKSNRESSITQMTSMLCPSLLDAGKLINLGTKEKTIQDLKKDLFFYQNRQYQWLLAESYEAFEDYIKNLYAYLCYLDNSFWSNKNFINIEKDEVKKKDFEWFVTYDIKKNYKTDVVIKLIRNKIPLLKKFEEKNSQGINYDFMIILISMLRHIIVHRKGFVKDKQKFIEYVLTHIGIYNDGKYKSEYSNIINSYFGINEYQKLIALIEIEDSGNQPGVMIYYDRFGYFLKVISSYALLLNDLIKSYISNGILTYGIIF